MMPDLVDLTLDWIEEDADWSTASKVIAGKVCRRRGCENPAELALNRGHTDYPWKHSDRWWAYCQAHAYERIVIDGIVYRPNWRKRMLAEAGR